MAQTETADVMVDATEYRFQMTELHRAAVIERKTIHVLLNGRPWVRVVSDLEYFDLDEARNEVK